MSVPSLTYEVSHTVHTSSSEYTTKTEKFSGMPDKCITFSYQPPFNTLNVKYTCTNTGLIYYEVRATKVGEEYGIGVGTRLYYSGPNIASNVEQPFTLTFTNENLPDAGNYLLGFYAKSDTSDGLWDVTYLYLSSEGYIVEPTDYEGIEVLTNQAIPSA